MFRKLVAANAFAGLTLITVAFADDARFNTTSTTP
jgi:hypothetical protein